MQKGAGEGKAHWNGCSGAGEKEKRGVKVPRVCLGQQEPMTGVRSAVREGQAGMLAAGPADEEGDLFPQVLGLRRSSPPITSPFHLAGALLPTAQEVPKTCSENLTLTPGPVHLRPLGLDREFRS